MDYFIKVKGAAAHGDNLAKIAAVREFIPLLASIPGEVEKALYIRGLAEETGLSEQAVAKELRAPATTRRNFPAGRTDVNDAKRQSDSGGVGLTPFEQELLQALCVDGEGAGSLRTEVKGTDWHHPELRELWPRLQKGLGQPQQLAPLLEGVADPQLRKGLAAAMVTELSEETDNESLVSGCHRALRKQRWDVAQKRLTQKIREAEAVSDREKIETLLAEKNRLMKQMHPSQTR